MTSKYEHFYFLFKGSPKLKFNPFSMKVTTDSLKVIMWSFNTAYKTDFYELKMEGHPRFQISYICTIFICVVWLHQLQVWFLFWIAFH